MENAKTFLRVLDTSADVSAVVQSAYAVRRCRELSQAAVAASVAPHWTDNHRLGTDGTSELTGSRSSASSTGSLEHFWQSVGS